MPEAIWLTVSGNYCPVPWKLLEEQVSSIIATACLWVLCVPLRANQSSPQASIQHDMEEISAKHQKKPACIVHLAHLWSPERKSLCSGITWASTKEMKRRNKTSEQPYLAWAAHMHYSKDGFLLDPPVYPPPWGWQRAFQHSNYRMFMLNREGGQPVGDKHLGYGIRRSAQPAEGPTAVIIMAPLPTSLCHTSTPSRQPHQGLNPPSCCKMGPEAPA